MRKLKVFNDRKQATVVGHFFKALTGDERSRAWCVKNSVGLQKAGAEFPDAAGGFLIPEVMDAAIIRVLETVGAFRQGAELRPTSSDAAIRPRRVGGLTANWVSEGQVIPESSFQLDAVEASMKKIAILARASSELFDDSASDLGEFLTREIGYAFASTEDDCGFNADGSSTYRGMSGLGLRLAGTKSAIAAASSHNTFLTLDAIDIANLISGVLGAAIPGSAWYISALGFAQTICRISAVSGGLVARQTDDGTVEATFMGFPVIFSARLPNVSTTLAGLPMLYFGNLAMSFAYRRTASYYCFT
jgi:HK97 family phage major capsid protein